MFKDGKIDDIKWKTLNQYHDPRGWLCELFRKDETPGEYWPEMGYVSVTKKGFTRGPHEHTNQSDYFCFLGPSAFILALWDNRPHSATYNTRQKVIVGRDNQVSVIIPPGVVHAYRNIGDTDGWVINFPNRLYQGNGRKEPVDEIRHELDPTTPFQIQGD